PPRRRRGHPGHRLRPGHDRPRRSARGGRPARGRPPHRGTGGDPCRPALTANPGSSAWSPAGRYSWRARWNWSPPTVAACAPTASWWRCARAGAARTTRCATPATAGRSGPRRTTPERPRASEQRGLPALPRSHELVAGQVVEERQRAHAEDHVGGQFRLAFHEVAHHVVPHHLLVDRVRLHVLGVEVDALLGRTHPA